MAESLSKRPASEEKIKYDENPPPLIEINALVQSSDPFFVIYNPSKLTNITDIITYEPKCLIFSQEIRQEIKLGKPVKYILSSGFSFDSGVNLGCIYKKDSNGNLLYFSDKQGQKGTFVSVRYKGRVYIILQKDLFNFLKTIRQYRLDALIGYLKEGKYDDLILNFSTYVTVPNIVCSVFETDHPSVILSSNFFNIPCFQFVNKERDFVDIPEDVCLINYSSLELFAKQGINVTTRLCKIFIERVKEEKISDEIRKNASMKLKDFFFQMDQVNRMLIALKYEI